MHVALQTQLHKLEGEQSEAAAQAASSQAARWREQIGQCSRLSKLLHTRLAQDVFDVKCQAVVAPHLSSPPAVSSKSTVCLKCDLSACI